MTYVLAFTSLVSSCETAGEHQALRYKALRYIMITRLRFLLAVHCLKFTLHRSAPLNGATVL